MRAGALGLAAAAVLALAACTSIEVVERDSLAPPAQPGDLPLALDAGLAPLVITPDDYGDAREWQQRLPRVLRELGVFERIFDDARDTSVDIRVEGRVGGRFHRGGFLNFFTWIPGPFVYMQAWRGSHFVYDAWSEVQILEACSGDPISSHRVETSHEFSFKSSNPGYLFGALIIIPGVVRGVMAQTPNDDFRRQTYERAYADLWQRVAAAIAADPALRAWGGESTRLCDTRSPDGRVARSGRSARDGAATPPR